MTFQTWRRCWRINSVNSGTEYWLGCPGNFSLTSSWLPDSLYLEYALSKAFSGVEYVESGEARKRHANSRMIIVTISNIRKYGMKITVTYQSCCDVHFALVWVWRAWDSDATQAKSTLVNLKSNRKITTAPWTQAQMIVIWLIFSEVYRKVKVRFQKKKKRKGKNWLSEI